MANEITIVVGAKDNTGPALTSAEQKTRKLAESTKQAGDQYTRSERQASGFGASLKRVGEVAAGVLVADTLQAGARRAMTLMQQTVQAASALGESVNAVNKVFGESSEQVQAWGRENANAIGLSTRAFNQMATPLGSMLKNQGLQMDEVTDHTIKLTQRAADMASVFNTDVTDALVAIQAGLRGEQDPLERYGVTLSAVAVEARAMAETHKTSTAQLTNAEKATARLNLIYEQTESTAGDFRDTADGLANAQRIATATMEDAKAKIGTAFIPIMAKAAELTGQFAERFASLPQPTMMVTAAVVGLGVALLLLVPRILATKKAIDEMVVSESLAQRTMGKTAGIAAKVGSALIVTEIAASAMSATLKSELNPQIEQTAKDLEKWDGATVLAGESARLFGENTELLIDALQRAGNENSFDKFMNSLGDGLGLAKQQLNSSTDRVKAFDDALAEMVRNGHADDAMRAVYVMAAATGKSINDVMALLPAYGGALKDAGGSTSDLGSATGTATEQIKAFKSEIDKFISGPLALEEAQDKAANAVQRLRDQIKGQKDDAEAGAGSLSGNTQAARDNREAVRDLVEMYAGPDGLIEKTKAAGGSTSNLVSDLENQLAAMGLSRAEIQRYLGDLKKLTDAINAIPSAKTVTIKVNATSARYRVEGATADILGFSHGGITTGGYSSAATGGARGGWTLVGEHGPELARLPFGSSVTPAGTTREMLSGGGGMWVAPIQYTPSGNWWDKFFEDFREQVQGRGGTLAVVGVRS